MKKLVAMIIGIMVVNPISYASDVLEFNIVGSIVSTTCYIKTGNQTVNLGTWQAQSLSGIGSGVGSQSDMVGYTLDFDCPAGFNINAQLEGNRYSASSIYYIDLDKSEGSATGAVIEMHFYSGNKWQSLVYGSNRTLISNSVDGLNSVKLRAYYHQISPTITPGTANSSVTLTISYE